MRWLFVAFGLILLLAGGVHAKGIWEDAATPISEQDHAETLWLGGHMFVSDDKVLREYSGTTQVNAHAMPFEIMSLDGHGDRIVVGMRDADNRIIIHTLALIEGTWTNQGQVTTFDGVPTPGALPVITGLNRSLGYANLDLAIATDGTRIAVVGVNDAQCVFLTTLLLTPEGALVENSLAYGRKVWGFDKLHSNGLDILNNTVVLGMETSDPVADANVRIWQLTDIPLGFWNNAWPPAIPEGATPSYGASVQLADEGRTLFVSDPSAGIVHQWQFEENRWQPAPSYSYKEQRDTYDFGRSFAITSGDVWIGAPGEREGDGVVYRFTRDGRFLSSYEGCDGFALGHRVTPWQATGGSTTWNLYDLQRTGMDCPEEAPQKEWEQGTWTLPEPEPERLPVRFVSGPPAPATADRDGDGIQDIADNCPHTANRDQTDANRDGIGDACEGALEIEGDSQEDPSQVAQDEAPQQRAAPVVPVPLEELAPQSAKDEPRLLAREDDGAVATSSQNVALYVVAGVLGAGAMVLSISWLWRRKLQ